MLLYKIDVLSIYILAYQMRGVYYARKNLY